MIYGAEKLFNKVIESVHCSDSDLEFVFTDKTKYIIEDNGQSCCERRYMHTDDCLSEFKGSKFVSAKIEDGPEETDGAFEVKVSQFLIVTTTKGQFTVVNYNEHNGYYGGFCVELREVK